MICLTIYQPIETAEPRASESGKNNKVWNNQMHHLQALILSTVILMLQIVRRDLVLGMEER